MNQIQLETKNVSASCPRTIRLCFYEPRAVDEHWLNRLVASVGKHYVSHVEIMFEDDMAASIFADETVFFRKRSYANPYYRIKAFTVAAMGAWFVELAFNALAVFVIACFAIIYSCC